MAVNIPLTRERVASTGDPLARTWTGWRRTATDDELWEANRGLVALRQNVRGERIATMSFDGRVQVVAEVDDRIPHDVDGGVKWELIGRVLRPGDPVHDALKGAAVPHGRVPEFHDTAEVEAVTAAERAAFQRREPVTMVVTWNPMRWSHDDYPCDVRAVASGRLLRDRWSTGTRKAGIEPGDRVFFLVQGIEERGIVGSGTAASRIFPDEQWDDDRAGQDANYVLIDWETLLLPGDGLPHRVLRGAVPVRNGWAPQGSGWVLSPATRRSWKTFGPSTSARRHPCRPAARRGRVGSWTRCGGARSRTPPRRC
jgi:hypothetical protein